ncbi:hypothetical protein [Streptomyces sp. CoH17]|uniref:hypothetical protein n=1 Tax=Streptomyces sp. CoH17 TaxID=2992806 RepID=UPI00226E5185|nr:hypothetical protein [Streptomyces sp. CoH17]
MAPENDKPMKVNDIVHGFCGGLFSRDSYECKRLIARGDDWGVFKDHYGNYTLLEKEELVDVRKYRDDKECNRHQYNEDFDDVTTCSAEEVGKVY